MSRNCEVKMVVICVHGMLAGTSELANRHDFCQEFVFRFEAFIIITSLASGNIGEPKAPISMSKYRRLKYSDRRETFKHLINVNVAK